VFVIYRWITILFLFLGLGGQTKVPGAVFLMIWPGARPTALAGSFTAISNDPTASYYNQAGLARIDTTTATLQHSNWLPGLHENMYYEYFGLAVPIRNGGTVGFQIIYLNTGETKVIDESGRELGRYTTFDIALGLSWGIAIANNLSLGIGGKFIYSYLVPDWVWKLINIGITRGGRGMTWCFDLGVLYDLLPFLTLGVDLQNFGPGISYTESGSKDPLPRNLRLGLNLKPVSNEFIEINITTDITKLLIDLFPFDTLDFMGNLRYELYEAWKSFGLEANYFNFLVGRVGYFIDKTGVREGVTFGGGIILQRFRFDIGVDQNIYSFPTSNYKFSLSYRF